MKEWVQKVVHQDRRALARVISWIEQQDFHSFQVLSDLWPFTGKAFTVGITGPAGCGKSTIVDQLILWVRKKNQKVGVVAIDPSSPFSGGAVLGDRIRMQRHAQDEGVFIRSVGSRGKKGGISFSTRGIVQALDAFGMDVIFVETLGVGQGEVDVSKLTDVTVLVLHPETGDSIQTLKAGLLEIADVFVVNKKDLTGAGRYVHDIETLISYDVNSKRGKPALTITQANTGEGIENLWNCINEKRKKILSSLSSAEDQFIKRKNELEEIVDLQIQEKVRNHIQSDKTFEKILRKEEPVNLYELAEQVVRDYFSPLDTNRPKANKGKYKR